MRRRVSDSEAPPAWVTSFDGSPYTSSAEFEAALEVWVARRIAWAAERGVDAADIPAYIPDAPFDPQVDV